MRVVEAYIGEYASGKSENAINRALELLSTGEAVTLADLDLVEPFYTLRPLKEELTARGLQVVAWSSGDAFGFGETGSLLKPEVRWVLLREGHVILDVGYGVSGSRVFNLLEGVGSSGLKVLAVLNAARPMTATRELIIEYLSGFERVDALINNTHLGDQTDLEFIRHGADIVSDVADMLNIPVAATAVEEKFRPSFPAGTDHRGNPVRFITRYMDKAFWS